MLEIAYFLETRPKRKEVASLVCCVTANLLDLRFHTTLQVFMMMLAMELDMEVQLVLAQVLELKSDRVLLSEMKLMRVVVRFLVMHVMKTLYCSIHLFFLIMQELAVLFFCMKRR